MPEYIIDEWKLVEGTDLDTSKVNTLVGFEGLTIVYEGQTQTIFDNAKVKSSATTETHVKLTAAILAFTVALFCIAGVALFVLFVKGC